MTVTFKHTYARSLDQQSIIRTVVSLIADTNDIGLSSKSTSQNTAPDGQSWWIYEISNVQI